MHLQYHHYILIVSVLCFELFENFCDACGCTTHNEIARRAYYWFNNHKYPEYAAAIAKYPRAFQNGACFPDWGYVVGASNAAEAAHWPPFIKAEADWIRQHYPKPWTKEAEQWVAFLLGQMSHSTADLTWHDMGIVYFTSHQGFIQSLGYSEYWGSFEIAHAISDNGGEAVVAYTMNTSFLQDVWYFPLADIYELYQAKGFTEVTGGGLLEGNTFLFAEAWATHFEGAELFPLAAVDSCFLQEQFLSFFMGGVDDMAWWSQKCWHSIIKWIETADFDSICYIQSEDSLQRSLSTTHVHNETNPTCQSKSLTDYRSNMALCRKHYRNRINSAWKARLRPYLEYITIQPEGRGVLLKMNTTALMARKRLQTLSSTKQSQSLESSSRAKNSTCLRITDPKLASNLLNLTFAVDSKYVYFGNSLTTGDFNGDGIEDLAVGGPGYTFNNMPQRGVVQIYFGNKNTKKFSTHQILGPYEYSRFGYALTTVDLNKDGIADLVVSAPTFLSERILYKGLVFIYLGRKNFSPTIPDFVINVGYYDVYNSSALGSFSNLGHTLYSYDIDGDHYNDLIIGCPFACDIDHSCNLSYGWENYQRGMVSVFLSSTFSKFQARNGNPVVIALNESDWLQFGTQSFQWFGFHVNFYVTSKHRRILMIGAPGATDWAVSKSLVGRLFAFDVTEITSGKTSLYWTIVGSHRFDKFGWWTSLGNPYVNVTNKESSSQCIAISAATTSTDQGIFHWFQSGKVILFPLDSLKYEGNYSSLILEQSSVVFGSDSDFARFGWRTLLVDINGDDIEDFLVASPYHTSKKDVTVGESGAFFVFLGGRNFPKIPRIITDAKKADWCLELPENSARGARFSSEMTTVDLNGDGKRDLVISAPRYTYPNGNEMVGIVFVVMSPFPPTS